MNEERPRLFELHERPDLGRPTLMLCLQGWIDAGSAADLAIEEVVAPAEPFPIASFDTEALIDHRARRPTLHLRDGVTTAMTWPSIELSMVEDRNGTPLLVLQGPEPDHRWRGFTRAVIDLALELDVSLVVGLGAYPAPAPHTRPPLLSATATSRELAAQVGFVNASIDIPAGVQAAIERACADTGLPAIGLWAQVPHYASGMPYPAAAAALLDGVRIVAGLEFDSSSLSDRAGDTRRHLDELIEGNEEHAHLVRQLEEQDDTIRHARTEPMPDANQLAAEIERFLREQHDE